MFENEQALVDAGFLLTPNVFHSGIGSGKVFGKSFANVAPFDDKNVEGGFHFDHFSVDPNGVVAPYVLQVNVVATPEVAPEVVPTPEVAEVAPETPAEETPAEDNAE